MTWLRRWGSRVAAYVRVAWALRSRAARMKVRKRIPVEVQNTVTQAITVVYVYVPMFASKEDQERVARAEIARLVKGGRRAEQRTKQIRAQEIIRLSKRGRR